MSVLDDEIKKYTKNGFNVQYKKQKKHGKMAILVRKKGGFSGLLGAQVAHVIYYADRDVNTSNIREFLKEYRKIYLENDFDTDDKGIFIYSGDIDKGLFIDLKEALIRDEDILNTISVKKAKLTEKRVSVQGLLKKIRKFEPPTKPKREKQLENMLISNLQAFYPNVRTQLTYERARVDAQIGSIGIEVKYQPNAGDFDRLYGQIEKYLKHLDSVIAVIGYERSKESTKYFKKRLQERGWLNKRVYVIIK